MRTGQRQPEAELRKCEVIFGQALSVRKQMKILFLCKRRPQGKDLIERPYGRFYYLPRILAEKGHDVQILLLSYKNDPKIVVVKDGIHWTSLSLLKHGPFAYLREAEKIIKQIKPNWVVGFSDTYYGILAQRLGTKYNISSLIDAYDNYESYIPWCRPLHYFWQRALAGADIITAAGPQLAGLMGQKRFDKKPTMVLPMAADPIGFKPLDKIKCRQELGLPSDKKLIGYCGSIHSNRGINVLFDAYKILLRENKDVKLVLTGRKGAGISIPDGARWLGYLPDGQIPGLLNSMDVLTVINETSTFGNFSYPVKLYEAMCCQVPVVATATPATIWILAEFPDFLAASNDSVDLSQKISRILQKTTKIDYGKKEGWEKESALFERAMIDHP